MYGFDTSPLPITFELKAYEALDECAKLYDDGSENRIQTLKQAYRTGLQNVKASRGKDVPGTASIVACALISFTHAAICFRTMLTVGVDIQYSQYDSQIQVRIGEHSQMARRGYQPISVTRVWLDG